MNPFCLVLGGALLLRLRQGQRHSQQTLLNLAILLLRIGNARLWLEPRSDELPFFGLVIAVLSPDLVVVRDREVAEAGYFFFSRLRIVFVRRAVQAIQASRFILPSVNYYWRSLHLGLN